MTKALTPKQRSAVERVRRNPDLQPFLFRKAKGVHWFPAFKEAGFLQPTEIPQPVHAKEEGYVNIPPWPITDYLAATSPELLEPDNEKYAVEFLQFIRDTTAHARERKYGNYRVWWQFSKIIRNIPPLLIQLDDVRSVDYWLDDPYEHGLVAEQIGSAWLDGLLDRDDAHSNHLALALLDTLYRLLFSERKYGASSRKDTQLRFDSWHAKKITKKVAGKAGQVLGLAAVHVFQDRLETVLVKLDNDNWSSIWRSAIEDHEQNHGADDAEDIIVQGYRDSLLAYVEAAPETSSEYVGRLLESPFEIIRRIAVFVIDQRYHHLSSLVDRLIEHRYFTSNFRHELWHLLRNHYNQFSADQKKRVWHAISALVEEDENGQLSEGVTAYRRAIWLSAIKDYGEDIDQFYRRCVDLAGNEPEHPDFSSYTTSGWVDHKSPIPMEELLSLEVDALAKRLNSYEDPGRFGEPGLEGLVKGLRQVVKAEPLRFYNQLHKFLESDLAFVYELIEAYHELWSEKAQLPWDEIWAYLLGFCLDIVNQERFWSPENVKRRSSFVANRYWIVGGIGRLIEDGTRSDERAFSERYLEQAEGLLITLLKKEDGEEFKIESDAVSVAINSPRGRCIEALINLTLRSCRLADRQYGSHTEVWTHFQPIYEAELARAQIGEYEFATLASNYLPNFLYMSKEWVLANLENIFDPKNYQTWLCAMQGYAYVNTVYEGIYKHLKDGGHFIRSLDDPNIRERVNEKVIENIAVAHIHDFESVDDQGGLIHQLVARRKYEELSHLIWFLWTLRRSDDGKLRDKIFKLWSRILGVLDTDTREGRRLASKLCEWTAFVDEVSNENRHLILAVAPYADEDYNSYELLKSIARISEQQPFEAYDIWVRVLERTRPDYPEEAIRATLGKLVQRGAEGLRKAKNIVDQYIKGGNDRPSQWLREITR